MKKILLLSGAPDPSNAFEMITENQNDEVIMDDDDEDVDNSQAGEKSEEKKQVLIEPKPIRPLSYLSIKKIQQVKSDVLVKIFAFLDYKTFLTSIIFVSSSFSKITFKSFLSNRKKMSDEEMDDLLCTSIISEKDGRYIITHRNILIQIISQPFFNKNYVQKDSTKKSKSFINLSMDTLMFCSIFGMHQCARILLKVVDISKNNYSIFHYLCSSIKESAKDVEKKLILRDILMEKMKGKEKEIFEGVLNAIRNNRPDSILSLLEYGEVDITQNNFKAFFLTIDENTEEIFYIFLDHELKKNSEVTKLKKQNCSEMLVRIVTKGRSTFLRKIVKEDLDNFDLAENSNYALRLSSQLGHTESVRILLSSSRVDPSASNNESLLWSAENGYIEIVKLLCADPRVDPTACDFYALRQAKAKGFKEIESFLKNEIQKIEEKRSKATEKELKPMKKILESENKRIEKERDAILKRLKKEEAIRLREEALRLQNEQQIQQQIQTQAPPNSTNNKANENDQTK